MDIKVRTNLQNLGFYPDDFENCPELALLEEILLNIDEENILSEDEAAALELAPKIAIDEIEKKLKEHGLDEDIWETHESVIEDLQTKLRSLDSLWLDRTIDTLRNERYELKTLEKELKKRLETKCLNSQVAECEGKWKKICLELQQLFQEIEKLNSVNNDDDVDANLLQEFSKSFTEKLSIFITNINLYSEKTWSGMKINSCETLQENHENACGEPKQANGVEISPINFEQRLTNSNFCDVIETPEIEGSNGCEGYLMQLTHLLPENKLSWSIDLKTLENVGIDILNLSTKQAQLEMKKEVSLHYLELVKAQRETWLESSENLLEILEKNVALMDLVSVVQFLWNKGNNDIHKALNDCYKHFQQEVANVKARNASLEESMKKFELNLNERLNKPYQQMLEKVPSYYFVPMEQNLPDQIALLEDKLQLTLNQHNLCIENRKKQLSVMEKEIDDLQVYTTKNSKKLSEITLGLNSAQNIIKMGNERRTDLIMKIAQDRAENNKHPLWVHFLTDGDKPKELLEEVNMPGTSVKPFSTSTPKGDH